MVIKEILLAENHIAHGDDFLIGRHPDAIHCRRDVTHKPARPGSRFQLAESVVFIPCDVCEVIRIAAVDFKVMEDTVEIPPFAATLA